jgi:predicted DNA binding CopG/RHH family protein
MRDYVLSDEEQQELDDIEQAIEDGAVEREPLSEERKRELQQAARNTLKKTRNINIRLTERDLHKLKVRAAEEGIPYQTLAASILHKA